MKKHFLAALLLPLGLTSHAQRPLPLATKSLTEAQAQAQVLADTLYLQQHYTKRSYRVPMRDGVKLYTTVYVPKDADRVRYPLMLKRTPYSVGPYAPTRYPLRISPSSAMLHEGYIFVFQDVRGKYMSEGTFVDVRPELAKPAAPRATDESTDTYDTIEFLLKKGPKNNGRVGQWGVSYPGFYTTAGLLSRHPALKAASPQAPVTDYFWDDYHHNGAYMLAASFSFLGEFGQPRPHPTAADAPYVQLPTPDSYDFFLRLGSLRHIETEYYRGQVAFWQEITQHPNYDATWRARDPRPHLHDLKTAVLTVGGFNDAEDLFGALHTYAAIEQQNPGLANRLVMGPWVHGGWAYATGEQVGNVSYGPSPSLWYQENVEAPFFKSYLKAEKPGSDLPEAIMFEGGTNRWRTFDAWPPKPAQERTLYFQPGGGLRFSPPTSGDERRHPDLNFAFDQFVSDPAHPVPYTEGTAPNMTPEYMTADQRFASRRPDVLTYQTPPLDENLTLAGPLLAKLQVATTGTDADWVVKLIDVYPDDTPDNGRIAPGVHLGGYQQLVRVEVMRGRFRESFSQPKAFVANEVTSVPFTLQDVLHTFRKGHRLMVQVQSTWFPLVDRNPQTYVPNIYEAQETDFKAQTHQLYHTPTHASQLVVNVLPPTMR